MSNVNEVSSCPVVVGVNVDIETIDAANAGAAGLLGRYSYGRYGVREGIWRLFDVFTETNIHATFFVIPEEVARYQDLLRVIHDKGHEIAVRGRVCASVGAAETIDQLGYDLEALKRLTGITPVGWRAVNGLVTEATLPALAELGYQYDSSSQDDDTPYVMSNGKDSTLVELPIFDYLTDSTFYTHRHTQARVAKAWFEEAHAQYCAGGYINLTLHSRGDVGSGRPPRARMVADFLREIGRRPGVAFYRADQLAESWLLQKSETEVYPSLLKPQV